MASKKNMKYILNIAILCIILISLFIIFNYLFFFKKEKFLLRNARGEVVDKGAERRKNLAIAQKTCRTIWDHKNKTCMKGSDTICMIINKYLGIWNEDKQLCEGNNNNCKNIDKRKPLWNSTSKTCEKGTNENCYIIDKTKPLWNPNSKTCEVGTDTVCASINKNKPFYYGPRNRCEIGSGDVCHYKDKKKPMWDSKSKTCGKGIYLQYRGAEKVKNQYNQREIRHRCPPTEGGTVLCDACCKHKDCIGGLIGTAACENWICVDKSLFKTRCKTKDDCPDTDGIIPRGTDQKCCKNEHCIGGAAGINKCENNRCVQKLELITPDESIVVGSQCENSKKCIGGKTDPKTTECRDGFCKFINYNIAEVIAIGNECDDSKECVGYTAGITECKRINNNHNPYWESDIFYKKICVNKQLPNGKNPGDTCVSTRQCDNGLYCDLDTYCKRIIIDGEKGCATEMKECEWYSECDVRNDVCKLQEKYECKVNSEGIRECTVKPKYGSSQYPLTTLGG